MRLSSSTMQQTQSLQVQRQRAKQLSRLIYLQALFLAATYFIGVWLALLVHNASLTLPEIIEHGVAASGFAILTGIIALMAGVQGMRKVSTYNFALFFITVLGGATGFGFLGNTTSVLGTAITNLSMMIVVGIGMPITGYSLYSISRSFGVAGREEDRPLSIMTYLALTSLALTVIAGAAVASTSLYGAMLLTHLSFAAFTVTLVLGVFVITIQKGFSQGQTYTIPRRVIYALLGLFFISMAAGTGSVYILTGPLPYAVVMAELAVLVYGFLILTIGTRLSIRPANTSTR